MGPYIALGKHRGPLRSALREIKQNGNLSTARYLGNILAHIIPPSYKEADLIAFVPSSSDSMRKRGFNPAFILADCISSFTGIPVEKNLITIARKTKKTGTTFKK